MCVDGWYLDVGELAEDDELALPVELVLDRALVPLGCIHMFTHVSRHAGRIGIQEIHVSI